MGDERGGRRKDGRTERRKGEKALGMTVYLRAPFRLSAFPPYAS
jgi:hypothetical protein